MALAYSSNTLYSTRADAAAWAPALGWIGDRLSFCARHETGHLSRSSSVSCCCFGWAGFGGGDLVVGLCFAHPVRLLSLELLQELLLLLHLRLASAHSTNSRSRGVPVCERRGSNVRGGGAPAARRTCRGGPAADTARSGSPPSASRACPPLRGARRVGSRARLRSAY